MRFLSHSGAAICPMAPIVFVSLILTGNAPAQEASPARPAGITIQGRLLDGSAMARSVNPHSAPGHSAGGTFSNVERIPLPNREFKLHLIDGPQRDRIWKGSSDAQGRFQMVLDVPPLPPTPCLVAEVEGERTLYSPAVAWSSEEVEFRSYPTTDSDRVLQSELRIQHTLEENKEANRQDLDVQVRLSIRNLSGELFVGRPRSHSQGDHSSNAREIFRVPVPADSKILLNSNSSGGKWTELPPEGGWKWLVVDSPILPAQEEPHGMTLWELKYQVPARQKLEMIYPAGLNLEIFAAWAEGEDLSLGTSEMLFPVSRPDIVGGRDLKAGTQIPLEVRVDNALLKQPNFDSLLILGGFLLATVIAILGGLLLGRRGPTLESILEEASGDEIIARIAQLDAKKERGEIDQASYRKTREKLIGMARYAVSELKEPERAPAKTHDMETGVAGGSLPKAAQDILERLRSLESEGPLDAPRIHERALLLEELAKVLGASSPGQEKEGSSSP